MSSMGWENRNLGEAWQHTILPSALVLTVTSLRMAEGGMDVALAYVRSEHMVVTVVMTSC